MSVICAPPYNPDPSRISAAWMDLYNSHGWVTEGNPAASCGGSCPTRVERHIVMLAAGSAHLYDTCCNEFFHQAAASMWSIFTYTDAPDPNIAVATAWSNGNLLLFGP